MQSKARKLALLLVGCAFGAVGVVSYKHIATWIPFGAGSLAQYDGSLASAACVTEPTENSDAILFISCGGIY